MIDDNVLELREAKEWNPREVAEHAKHAYDDSVSITNGTFVAVGVDDDGNRLGMTMSDMEDEIERLRGQLHLTERARDAMAIRFGLMAEEDAAADRYLERTHRPPQALAQSTPNTRRIRMITTTEITTDQPVPFIASRLSSRTSRPA